MKTKKIVAWCAALLLLWQPVRAQVETVGATDSPVDSALVLSLTDAQRYALEHNRSLQNASLSVKQAEASRWQSIAAMLPQVDASLDYINMCGYKMSLMGMDMSMPPYGTLGITASVAINGQMIMAILLNNLSVEMQDISRQQSEQNLSMNVMQTYISILLMEDMVNLLEQNLQNVDELRTMTQRAVDVGTQEQTAADQIAVRVNTLKNSINSTKRSIELYYNSMRVLLGVSVDTDLNLTQTLDELLNAETTLQLLGSDFDVNRNYDYQLLVKNTELAKKQVTTAALAYTPTLSAYYQYSNKKYFSDEETMNMTAPNVVGVTLSVPIWSSGKRASAVTEKKLAYKAAQNTLVETKDNLQIQDSQLRFNLSNAYETFMNEKENLDVTQRIFESTSNKFTHGVASSLELTNASNDLLSAQNTYMQAALTLVGTQIELHKFLNKEE